MESFITAAGLRRLDDPPDSFFQPRTLASGLAQIQRFAGCCWWSRYSVARHTLLMVELIREFSPTPETILAAMFHDAAEMVTGDVTRPVQRQTGAASELSRLQTRIWMEILERRGVDLTRVDFSQVHAADDRILRVELMVIFGHEDEALPDPAVCYRREDFLNHTFEADRNQFESKLREALAAVLG